MSHLATAEDLGTIESGLDLIESFQVYFQKKVIVRYSYFKKKWVVFTDSGFLVKNVNEVIDDIYIYIDKRGEDFSSDVARDLLEKLERILPLYLSVVDKLKNELSAPTYQLNKHKKLIARYELLLEDLHDILAAREAMAEESIPWEVAKAELGL